MGVWGGGAGAGAAEQLPCLLIRNVAEGKAMLSQFLTDYEKYVTTVVPEGTVIDHLLPSKRPLLPLYDAP
jgi:hypothetical protein